MVADPASLIAIMDSLTFASSQNEENKSVLPMSDIGKTKGEDASTRDADEVAMQQVDPAL